MSGFAMPCGDLQLGLLAGIKREGGVKETSAFSFTPRLEEKLSCTE